MIAPSIKSVSTFLHCSVFLNCTFRSCSNKFTLNKSNLILVHDPSLIREPNKLHSNLYTEEYGDEVTHLNDDDEYSDENNSTDDELYRQRISSQYKQQIDNRYPGAIPFNYNKNSVEDSEEDAESTLRNRRNTDKNVRFLKLRLI